VIIDGDTLRMWFGGGNILVSGGVNIRYAVSVDGIKWKKYKGNPILSAVSATPSFGNAFLEPCVLFDGKQYRMWFAAWHGATPSIGYAISINKLPL